MASPTTPSPVSFSRKDASHRAFYAGFLKGAGSATEGMRLFATSPNLRKIWLDLVVPMANYQLVYLSAAGVIFYAVHNRDEGLRDLLWTISRWGRLVTVVLNVFLDLYNKANSTIFFAALREKSPAFAEALESMPVSRPSLRTRWLKLRRVVKLTAFKMAGNLVRYLIPGGRFIAMPALEFVSMRPVLGNPVALAVSSVHALPIDMLEKTAIDDLLLSFGESVIDADDLGADITKQFTRRLDDDVKAYFAERYRGYIVGCGFVYSMLSAVPLLGVPLALIAECGAACVVADVVERNLEKENRIAFPAEETITRAKDKES